MVKRKQVGKARVGIVIYTPQGALIPSAATLAKMKASQKRK